MDSYRKFEHLIEKATKLESAFIESRKSLAMLIEALGESESERLTLIHQLKVYRRKYEEELAKRRQLQQHPLGFLTTLGINRKGKKSPNETYSGKGYQYTCSIGAYALACESKFRYQGAFADAKGRAPEAVYLVREEEKVCCEKNSVTEETSLTSFSGQLALEFGLNVFQVVAKFPFEEEMEVSSHRVIFIPDQFDGPEGLAEREYSKWLVAHPFGQFNTSLPSEEGCPRFSLIIPCYNPGLEVVKELVLNLQSQSFSSWEAIIVEDGSSELDHLPFLEALALEDSRFLVCFLDVNRGISGATNIGIGEASGDWVVFLDQDDRLHSDALKVLSSFQNEYPDSQVMYSDEDKLGKDKIRFEPSFKPHFNPDLLTGQNYLNHLTSIRRNLLQEDLKFQSELDGAQDWDFWIRVTEKCHPHQIVHIPRTLYHWRAEIGSTAWHEGEKDTAGVSVRLLEEAMERRGIQGAEVQVVDDRYYRVVYPLPEPLQTTAIIMPTRDQAEKLRACVTSILDRTTLKNFRIYVINDHSEEPETFELFDELHARGVEIVNYPGEGPFNFSRINNWAARQFEEPLLAFLNNDLEVMEGGGEDWLREMVSQVCRPEIGVVGCKLLYPDMRIQHAGVILGIGGDAGHACKYQPRDTSAHNYRSQLVHNVSAVTAACCLVRRDVFEEVGGFDEENLPVAFNDVDFCLRVQEAGYRNLYTPFAELIHHESATRGPEDTPEKQARFKKEIEYMIQRWGDILYKDPAYNPNLTLEKEDFSLAWPPRLPEFDWSPPDPFKAG